MSSAEIQKLLGGYATDTLTDAERRALFEAALTDQELFDVLAKEQALQDVLGDPAARMGLLAALEPVRDSRPAGTWNRLRRPLALAVAGGMAAVLLVVIGLTRRTARRDASHPVREAELTSAPTSNDDSRAPAQTQLHDRTRLSAKASAGDVRKAGSRALLLAPFSAPPPPGPATEEAKSAVRKGPATEPAAGLTASQPAQAFVPPAPMMPMPQAKMKRASALQSISASAEVPARLLLKGASGDYYPVGLQTVFRTGDAVRLRVNGGPVYLYLYERDTTGAWTLLASLYADRPQSYDMPSNASIESRVAGPKELLLVFASHPQTQLDSLPATTDPGIRMYTITLHYQ
jgi:hypothetical protein